MSGGVLVIAEARLGELRDVSLELVSAALSVKADAGGRVAVAMLDHEPDRFADRSRSTASTSCCWCRRRPSTSRRTSPAAR